MKITTHLIIIASLFISTLAFAQEEESILPAQVTAIRALAEEQGFTPIALNEYLTSEWGAPLYSLTRQDAVRLIQLFQSDNPPSPPVPVPSTAIPSEVIGGESAMVVEAEQQQEAVLAEILEVGMSKRFHLVDGNIIEGTIISVEDNVCRMETIDGMLNIPTNVILEETADITKNNDTRYIGPVLKETAEEIVLRSPYGDVVISKRDIREMDRYHGGQWVPWAEERKTFYSGEEVLTDVMMDPTAFPLEANTFYLSGLSIGYGFTDRFMVRSRFGNDFSGDLNLHPLFQFYHRETGVSEVGAALGFNMFNHHPMQSVVSNYAKYITVVDSLGEPSLDEVGTGLSEVLTGDLEQFYWEVYLILSSRRALASGRGKMGWHLGIKTNSLILSQPKLQDGYSWDTSYPWITEDMIIPFRAWASFEYDLSKQLKLMMNMWADNGHKFRTFGEAWEDYASDDTPFILDSPKGDYRTVDFDFGFLYAISETFRLGIHFQEPYLLFYWEFYEL